ncbi:hypothetical protein [Nostoc sp. MS1]|uniref:hypothetical protein n=1 Tax=Nostoc sp. MS1 TaxID=2764711 RepID=UPI001CC7B418|nr:hypothetical protein [Nostoc sp. MS1]
MVSVNSKLAKNIGRTKKNQKLSTVNNLLCTGLSITAIACTYATIRAISPFIVSSVSAASGSSFQPTSIMWLTNQSECERSGRYWYDKQCWDAEHQPMF